ncbi:MAG: hypothetical protein ACRDRB_04140 [Pseudonocardiaceae bacterium]
MAEQPEIITQICPLQGDGEHKVIALTSKGRMFERRNDPRGNFNRRPGQPLVYEWVEFQGPRLQPGA